MFTKCLLYIGYVFTVCSLYVHYMLAIYSLYFNSLFTICSLYVHYISFWLVLDLAGSNLANTLLNRSKSNCISYFSELFLNSQKESALLMEPFPYNHRVIDVLAGLNNTKEIL